MCSEGQVKQEKLGGKWTSHTSLLTLWTMRSCQGAGLPCFQEAFMKTLLANTHNFSISKIVVVGLPKNYFLEKKKKRNDHKSKFCFVLFFKEKNEVTNGPLWTIIKRVYAHFKHNTLYFRTCHADRTRRGERQKHTQTQKYFITYVEIYQALHTVHAGQIQYFMSLIISVYTATLEQ